MQAGRLLHRAKWKSACRTCRVIVVLEVAQNQAILKSCYGENSAGMQGKVKASIGNFFFILNGENEGNGRVIQLTLMNDTGAGIFKLC